MKRATPKQKPPVLVVTEDGVEMFHGDMVFWGYKNYKKVIPRKAGIDQSPVTSGIKAFSTELKCQQFLGIAPKYKFHGTNFYSVKAFLSQHAHYQARFEQVLDDVVYYRLHDMNKVSQPGIVVYSEKDCQKLLDGGSYKTSR